MNYIKLQLFFILSLLTSIEVNADTWYAEAECNVNVQPGYPEHLGNITLWG